VETNNNFDHFLPQPLFYTLAHTGKKIIVAVEEGSGGRGEVNNPAREKSPLTRPWKG